MFNELAYKLQILLCDLHPQRTLDFYRNREQAPKGHALVSYMPLPVIGDAGRFRGHSNVWESAEIVRTFNRLGYAVDVVHWQDASFVPRREYAAVFDIHLNLLRYGAPASRRIFHVTGSNPRFSNEAEQLRLDALRTRRGAVLVPRRSIGADDMKIFMENVEKADLITLIGNEVTAATFPAHIRQKMHLVSATGSLLPSINPALSRRLGREFLWFNGSGAVHKGLDLVLEVFARHPEFKLHIIGPYLKEHDFVKAYHHELNYCSNIRSHGFLYPSSSQFRKVADRVAAFISPSCSEGISTSAITCMQSGMIPIIGFHSGITLPAGAGYQLDQCTFEEIEGAVTAVADKSEDDIREMSMVSQEYALRAFSRVEFSRLMGKALLSVMSKEKFYE